MGLIKEDHVKVIGITEDELLVKMDKNELARLRGQQYWDSNMKMSDVIGKEFSVNKCWDIMQKIKEIKVSKKSLLSSLKNVVKTVEAIEAPVFDEGDL